MTERDKLIEDIGEAAIQAYVRFMTKGPNQGCSKLVGEAVVDFITASGIAWVAPWSMSSSIFRVMTRCEEHGDLSKAEAWVAMRDAYLDEQKAG